MTLRRFGDAFRHKPDCFAASLMAPAPPGKAPALSLYTGFNTSTYIV
jgi:hypothetical protein